MEAWWKTWTEVKTLVRGRKIILYGRSDDWVPKTLVRLPHKPAYIVDRNEGYTDTVYLDTPVYLPSRLDKEKPEDIYIIITAGEWDGILAILEGRGLEAGKHFCCCPEYRDFQLLEEMRNYEQKIIVSCSDYVEPTNTRYSRAGGGLYRYHIGPNQMECLVPGQFRQVERVGDHLYAVEYVEMKLYQFDLDFKVVEKYPLDEPGYCGLAHAPNHDALILINAGSDTISVHDRADFKLVERIHYSQQLGNSDEAEHHLNDACTWGNRLFVSYFSHSGNWKKGIFDGGVSEFHLDRLGDGPQPVYRDLWMPHSPKIIDRNLCVLDSMRGRLYTQTQVVAGEFDGLARGLAYDDRFYYVGLSEDMYVRRLFGVKKNIMLNAGFFMFDLDTHASRFYPMLDNMNVHDLLVL